MAHPTRAGSHFRRTQNDVSPPQLHPPVDPAMFTQNAPWPNMLAHCWSLAQPQVLALEMADPQRDDPPPIGRKQDPPLPQGNVSLLQASFVPQASLEKQTGWQERMRSKPGTQVQLSGQSLHSSTRTLCRDRHEPVTVSQKQFP